jgi:S-adenosyl methyltransferase
MTPASGNRAVSQSHRARPRAGSGGSGCLGAGFGGGEPLVAGVGDDLQAAAEGFYVGVAKSNREFLRRVVRYLVAEAGVTQFLDLGSGLPTQGNVSEVAHELEPDVHVVHVDNDPVAYTHSKALLADARTTDFVTGDVRDPAEILADPVVRSLIDFERPVGLLAFAILHHLEDRDHPGQVMAEFRDAMPRGSYLAISSFRLPGPDLPELRALTIQGEKLTAGTLGSGWWREDDEILSWFGDWELADPGLVPIVDWRPQAEDNVPYPEVQQSFSGGVARKP